MAKTTVSILLAAAIAAGAPASAEQDFGQIVSGIAQSLLTQEVDRTAYVQAQNLNTVAGYRDYLAKYPNGAFRGNAQAALTKLGATTLPTTPGNNQSAASVEASLGLSRTQRIQIQKQLTTIGYATGVADGLWGANTRNAIQRWQTANKQPSTGYVTAAQVRLIAKQAGPGTGSGSGVVVDDPVEESLLGLTTAERREVQRRLNILGYATGGIDGTFGRQTRNALSYWQQDEGLRPTGYLTADQLRLLRSQTSA